MCPVLEVPSLSEQKSRHFIVKLQGAEGADRPRTPNSRVIRHVRSLVGQRDVPLTKWPGVHHQVEYCGRTINCHSHIDVLTR